MPESAYCAPSAGLSLFPIPTTSAPADIDISQSVVKSEAREDQPEPSAPTAAEETASAKKERRRRQKLPDKQNMICAVSY